MDVKFADAVNAYSRALNQNVSKGLDSDEAKSTGGFTEALKDFAEDTAQTTKAAEVTEARALAGKADVVDVVTAVANAEMAVDTVVAVRDRVIQAYNDIIRMPI